MEKDCVKIINEILGITESYKATYRMLEIIYDRQLREEKMRELLEAFDYDVSYDWFRDYFEQEQAERTTKKQDFTPQGVTELVSRLVGTANKNYDCCCGTGGITITKWHQDKQYKSIFSYFPSDYIYHCEELSDRAIPFLLFNLAIRGMNAVVCQCDALTRECQGVWFIYNEKNDILGFSTINLMPYTEKIEKVFKVKFTENKYEPLIESRKPELSEVNKIYAIRQGL